MDLNELKYSKDHCWLKIENDTALLGLTDHAQKELGDVVFLDLVEVGESFDGGSVIGNIESVKATSDLIAPVAGEIIEVNNDLTDQPDTLNEDPYGNGWIYKFKISDSSELDSLMDKDTYEEFALNQ